MHWFSRSTKKEKDLNDAKVPVSLKLLDLKMNEFRSEMTTYRLETKAEFTQVRADINQGRMEFSHLKAEVKSDIAALLHEIRVINAAMQAKIDKVLAIVEEQNTRNRYAMDGYTIVYEKLQETDARLERIEKHLFGA